MEQRPLNQSAPRRAINDTISTQKTAKFMWGGEGVLAVAGGTWLAQIAPVGVSTLEIVARSVLGGLVGLAVAFVFILSINLMRAPVRQRNEARALLLVKPKVVPLQNRDTLIRAIVNVKRRVIDLKTAADVLNRKEKTYQSPQDELLKRDHAFSALLDANKKLDEETLVAGETFRSIIDNLTRFIDYHMFACMNIFLTDDDSIRLKKVDFMSQLSDKIDQAIRELDGVNQQVLDNGGSHTE